MIRAFVLAKTDPGSEEEVQEGLRNVEGIVSVFQVYGLYDLVIQIEANSEKDLRKLVFLRIRRQRHIANTMTLTALPS